MKLRAGAYNSHVRSPVLALLLLVSVTLAAPTSAAPLQGGIEHLDILPSLNDNLKKGARFPSSSLKEIGEPANEWVKLPAWICGTWRIDEETTVARKDFASGEVINKPMTFKTHQTFHYGMRKDKQGHVWHYIGAPYSSSSKLTLFAEHHIVSEKKFDRADAQMVRFRSVMTVVRVSGSRISESYQQESITSYSPNPDNAELINLRASTKTFDELGQPGLQADNVAEIRRVKPFAEINEYKGKDMRVLFREFLSASGMANLGESDP